MATDPSTADAAAKQAGLPLIERLRALRTTFGLSLAAAKAVTDATDGRPPRFPEIRSPEQLTAVLAAELGYCGCASEAAQTVLRDLLRAVRNRADALEDLPAFAQASRALEALLAGGGGWAEWLVHLVEQRDLAWHGFRQTDLWITDKGRWLLDALERHGPGRGGCASPLPGDTQIRGDAAVLPPNRLGPGAAVGGDSR
jgi:hypothetical protein